MHARSTVQLGTRDLRLTITACDDPWSAILPLRHKQLMRTNPSREFPSLLLSIRSPLVQRKLQDRTRGELRRGEVERGSTFQN